MMNTADRTPFNDYILNEYTSYKKSKSHIWIPGGECVYFNPLTQS